MRNFLLEYRTKLPELEHSELKAMLVVDEEKDAKQHGVKGMHWGIRRSRSELRTAAAKRAFEPAKKMNEELDAHLKKHAKDGTTDTKAYLDGREAILRKHIKDPAAADAAVKRYVIRPEGEPKKVVGAASGETSPQRYARLAEQAKSGRANEMDEQDLKFFNARTEALAKIAKMNETQPGWLAVTTKKVLQNAAQTAMQDVATGATKKLISGPLLETLNKSRQAPEPSLSERVAAAAKQQHDKEQFDSQVKTAVEALRKQRKKK